MSTILEMKGISKDFPGVRALHDVTFEVREGEMHSLIGQNGAGKSTLMKILAGQYTCDAGSIMIGGARVSISGPKSAQKLGISIVYQELSLLPNLTVADNIFLGREFGDAGVINEQAIMQGAAELIESLGIKGLDVTERVGNLPLAKQQLVEIAKALSFRPRILVLDEPTAALADDDCERLFSILRNLKKQGIAIIFISHRLKEILRNCDRGTVLRNGSVVGTVNIPDTSEDELVRMMIGGEVAEFYRRSTTAKGNGEVVLEVQNLSIPRRFDNVSFQIHRGEIVGITGLLGAGQNDIARALFGLTGGVKGSILLNGTKVNICSPGEAIRLGIGLLTEDRKGEGLFMDMNVRENITLPSLSLFKISPFIPLISQRKEANAACEFAGKVNVVMHSLRQKVKTLSGGNQQKAILARWLLRNLELLVFIEPTRGIDVSAKAEIYGRLHSLTEMGKSVIIVSTDSAEILGVSDRIFVMYKGQLTTILKRAQTTDEMLLTAIQGGAVGNEAE